MNNNQKVILAISGGVDSAVAAHILKRDGYEVHAVYFDFWKYAPLNNRSSVENMQSIAKNIGVSFQKLDKKVFFHNKVIKPFIEGLESGETPNPCMRCNPAVKFTLLREIASVENAQYIATGHYARVTYKDNEGYILLKGVDNTKDQSYVLAYLDQETLSKLILPLGTAYKKDILSIANGLNIKTFISEESQDLCFVDSPKYKQFIEDNAEKLNAPGPIYDSEGNKLGDHQGLIFYTIGQRKGIGIAAGKPYYVKRKDTEKNALIVGKSSELGIDNFQVDQIHWINQEPAFPLTCDVKIRYRAKPIMCKVNMVDKTSASIKTYVDIRDITPGQFAVFYDAERVLGAAKITEAGTK